MALLKEVLHSAAHLLYPRLCEGCRLPLLGQERILCISCCFQLPQTGFHDTAGNEAALRIAGRVPYQHATSFAYFTADGLLQHLLHRLKYSGRKAIGTYLGEQAGYALKASQWINSIDGIIPVPLHPKKEQSRGYNQSNLLALGLSKVLNVPVFGEALMRTRYTGSQTKMSREERVRNVKDAFILNPRSELCGRHALLIDDVLTTGATLESAAAALMKSNGLKLSICTIGLAKD